jgi:hypothetical protein
MQNNNTASRANILTAKQLVNLETYGFLDVTITDGLPDEKTEVSVDRYGKPDNEVLICNKYTAEKIAQHLRKTGWSRQSGHFAVDTPHASR